MFNVCFIVESLSMNRDFTLPFQKWGREVIVEMNKDRHKRVEAN